MKYVTKNQELKSHHHHCLFMFYMTEKRIVILLQVVLFWYNEIVLDGLEFAWNHEKGPHMHAVLHI